MHVHKHTHTLLQLFCICVNRGYAILNAYLIVLSVIYTLLLAPTPPLPASQPASQTSMPPGLFCAILAAKTFS